MNGPSHRAFERLVDAHFAARISRDDETRLRQHLPECAACRARYERQLLFARLDPAAPSARDRIGAALGLRRPHRRVVSAALLALTTACVAFALVTAGPRRPPDFLARGAAPQAAAPSLSVYRIRRDAPPEPAPQRMAAEDELAFAYSNPAGFRHLLVFGVDDAHEIYWYHPAWQSAAQDPRGVTIGKTLTLRELPEGVQHQVRGRQLRVVALFTDDGALSVRKVEEVVRRAPDAPRFEIPGTHQTDCRIEIERTR